MKKKLKPIMFVGTASDVGKSIITTGFCRILKQDGLNPAPFKAQNMSLNSFATPDGFEIGRAQAVQAEACGIPCSTDMNPILLKPTNEKSSQVVLNGKPLGNQSAYEYFMGNDKEELFREAKQAFKRLSEKYNPVVMEGAGSISELNLKHRDITNMRMAMHVGADTYLIGDIDRGGIFGSLYGTIALLTKEEKMFIKGIVVNKFRGDAKLFEQGKKKLEELCGIPVVGIVPYLKDLHIEEEDSVGLKYKFNKATDGKVNIAIILLNRLANYTDFKVLERDARVHLFYSNDIDEIGKAEIIIIPGSKNTIQDLIEIKNNGIALAILQAFRNNKTVIGICGGFQMMGQTISDPFHVEGEIELMPGLGILPVETILKEHKVTNQCLFNFKNYSSPCEGYEIHMGITKATISEQPLNSMINQASDSCNISEGYIFNDKCWGTYIHGILDNEIVIEDLISEYTVTKNLKSVDYKTFKEKQYDHLANHLREHLDVKYMYQQLSI